MWVKFTDEFTFRPTNNITLVYQSGGVHNVTTPCAEKALNTGAAIKVDKEGNEIYGIESSQSGEAGTEDQPVAEGSADGNKKRTGKTS